MNHYVPTKRTFLLKTTKCKGSREKELSFRELPDKSEHASVGENREREQSIKGQQQELQIGFMTHSETIKNTSSIPCFFYAKVAGLVLDKKPGTQTATRSNLKIEVRFKYKCNEPK